MALKVRPAVQGTDDAALRALCRAHDPDDYPLRYWRWFWQTATEVLLATDGSGTPVGLCRRTTLPDRSSWIATIRIHPQLRGQGLGRQLTAAAVERSHDDGLTTARLLTSTGNIATATMLPRVGMHVRTNVAVWHAQVPALPPQASLQEPSRPLESLQEATRLLGTSSWIQRSSGLVAGWYVMHEPTGPWLQRMIEGRALRQEEGGGAWFEWELDRGRGQVLAVQPVQWGSRLLQVLLRRAQLVRQQEVHLFLPADHHRALALEGAGFHPSPWANIGAIYQGRTG